VLGVVRYEPQRFHLSVGPDVWGVLLTVYGLSFAAIVAGPAGMGWGIEALLYLMVVTFAADIAAAWWGKALGRLKVLRAVSPNKTWVGTIGGVCTAACFGGVLWPWLPLPSWGSSLVAAVAAGVVGGLLLGVTGFFGDAVWSAFKRDHGLDVTGRWFPGQGGVLDRFDSMTLAAPVLYGYLYVVSELGGNV